MLIHIVLSRFSFVSRSQASGPDRGSPAPDRPASRTRLRLGAWDAWLSLLAWMLALVALWQLVGVPPARGYELSIYDALPPAFLYALQASLALHVFVAARACFRRDRDHLISVAALSGLAGIVFNTAVVLSLPYLRGYLALAGDFSSHLARSIDIASIWNIGKDVFYPALYAILQVVHVATGLDSSVIWFLGGTMSYVLYVLLCIMAANRLLVNKRTALFAGVAAAIPVAGAYLRTMTPVSISVQILPLVFFLYTRSKRKEGPAFNLLLVLLLVLFPFLHPLTSLMIILWLTLLTVVRWWLSRASLQQHDAGISQMRTGTDTASPTLIESLILGITWFAWLSSFALWNKNVREVANWLSGEARTQLARIDQLAGRSGLSALELAELVFKQESGIIIYTGLALASLPLFFFLTRRQRVGKRIAQYLLPLCALLALSVLVSGFAVVGPMGGFDFYRFARFTVPWATLILAAAPLLVASLRSRARFLISALVICSLIVVALGGFWALHLSPYVYQPNDQMTLQEVGCMRWIYRAGNGRDVRGIWPLGRLTESVLHDTIAGPLPPVQKPLPDHFGYDGASSLNSILAGPTYLLITEHHRATVLDLWASVNKYAEEDFHRLEKDRAAILLYANGGCDIWAARLGIEDRTQ
jgi:hypothetical protein